MMRLSKQLHDRGPSQTEPAVFLNIAGYNASISWVFFRNLFGPQPCLILRSAWDDLFSYHGNAHYIMDLRLFLIGRDKEYQVDDYKNLLEVP